MFAKMNVLTCYSLQQEMSNIFPLEIIVRGVHWMNSLHFLATKTLQIFQFFTFFFIMIFHLIKQTWAYWTPFKYYISNIEIHLRPSILLLFFVISIIVVNVVFVFLLSCILSLQCLFPWHDLVLCDSQPKLSGI